MEMENQKTLLEHCTVVRPSNYLDRMFYIQHRVGAQANVVVSAHYTPVDLTAEKCLSREAIYSALRSVIDAYPELSLIGVPELLAKSKHHGLHLAALREIDLDTCVEFLDDAAPRATPEVLERLHNEWDWTDDQFNPRKPWWKLVVLGRQEFVFVFHHLICDGRFGQTFHRELLAGLNSFDEKAPLVSHIVEIDPERVRLSKDLEKFWISTTSVLRVIHDFFACLLLRLFFGSRLLFSDSPKPKPHSMSITAEAGPEHRTISRVSSIRIPAARMRRILSACRENNSSLTPLLLVMTMCTLACDCYPEAKVGVANCALDVRSLYPQENESTKTGRLLQCAGGHRKFTWLNRCRQLLHYPDLSVDAKTDTKPEKVKMDIDGIWQMTREYRDSIAQGFKEKNSRYLVMFRAANSALNDLEEMLKSAFPALSLYLNKSFQVSNLGVFSTKDQDGPWKIDDMTFSASTVNGNISYKLNLCVTGVEGGDTVIIAGYEDGVLTEDMVSKILEATIERIEAML